MLAAFAGGILYTGGANWPFTGSLILLALTVCATLIWVRRLTHDRSEVLVAPAHAPPTRRRPVAKWGLHPAVAADWPEIAALLSASGLPLAGAEEHLAEFALARRTGALLGCAALERYGRFGLLRSVAVAPDARGSGLGQVLVSHVLGRADEEGLRAVALLTTTAAAYFPRFGFRVVERAELPAPVQESVEFREACPASATAMLRTMQATDATIRGQQ